MASQLPKSVGRFKLSAKDHLTKVICEELCTYLEYQPREREEILDSRSPGSAFLNRFEEKEGGIQARSILKLIKILKEIDHAATAAAISDAATFLNLFALDEEDWQLPEDAETDEDLGGDAYRQLTFAELLNQLGLKNCFPSKLKLDKLTQIKDPKVLDDQTDVLELFWQRISSLDYRIRSSKALNLGDGTTFSRPVSVRDLLFAVLQCADSFLRQDIIEKLSACHLAVPIILQGVQSTKVKLMLWSVNRIVKKWKDSASVALEQHIAHVPLFTVSFLRVGDIKRVSKSIILNDLLGPCQGNDAHPFFLTKEFDHADPVFSKGNVECVWYLPMNANGAESFKWVTSFFNLRGNAIDFPIQREFVCKASDLVIVFLQEENRTAQKEHLRKIKIDAPKSFFVVFHEDNLRKLFTRKHNLIGNCLHVREFDLETLNKEISTWIVQCHDNCDSNNFRSLQDFVAYCGSSIEIEEKGRTCDDAKRHVQMVLSQESTENLSEFKSKAFPLQDKWKDWVRIDKELLVPDSDKEESIDVSRDEKSMRKRAKRTEQLMCGLSQTMQIVLNVLKTEGSNENFMRYFLYFLEDRLFNLVEVATKNHLVNIETCERDIKILDELIKPTSSAQAERRATFRESVHSQHEETQERYKEKRKQLKKQRQTEVENFIEKNIGWEHFFRELGQWHEAHTDLQMDSENEIMLLPRVAAKLLKEGHSVELMDGDTGRVPLSWITSVLDQLTYDLWDPSILVLCVLGVQSSGKSTLLNSMFGVKFPVRAGRCTRGLFIRMLHMDDDYASKLGFKHIFLVDSEGVRSLERTLTDEYRFDNELVTLALCIADITILNIEGENIGPEMTCLLEIAAHAFMRMKEVDLHSQCRIIQQRVSDLTASRQNKMNMDLVLRTLNEATVQAAREEGFEGKYQQFSDVFDLRINENLQFIPCLWTGPMSPPSQFYGEIVLKLKADIFSDINTGKVVPQFTLSTFIQRIRDVWVAVKGENFLFNFQDSVKAVDFNSLTMELNKQIINMRLHLKEKLIIWKNILLSSADKIGDALQSVENELSQELNTQKVIMNESFETYVSQHKRGHSLQRYHNDWFKRNVDETVSKTKGELMSIIRSDAKCIKVKTDIPIFASKLRGKLLEIAKSEAKRFRNSKGGGNTSTRNDPEIFFEDKWNQWKEEIRKEFPKFKMTEKAIEAACESLLLSITDDMAVSTEMRALLEVGGIKMHSEIVQWEKYYSQKDERRSTEECFLSNGDILQGIIESSVAEMEHSSQYVFDANLIQYILRNSLKDISFPSVAPEPPNRLKAKLLLHICGKISKIAVKKHTDDENANALHRLLEAEKTSIYKDFIAFLQKENQIERVVECMRTYFIEWGKALAMTHIGGTGGYLVAEKGYFANVITNRKIIAELGCQENINDYLKFIGRYPQYRRSWLVNAVQNLISESQKIVRDGTLSHMDTIITDLTSLLSESMEPKNDTKSSKLLFRECFDNFLRGLLKRGFAWHQEMASEVYTYNVSDAEKLSSAFKNFIQSRWKDDIIREIKVFDLPSKEFAKVVRDMIKPFLNEMQALSCFEQCPMCKAPCDNMGPIGKFHEHFSFSHFPRGIMGSCNLETSRLLTETCIASVASENATYFYPGDRTPRLCKNYKKDFPTWIINGVGETMPQTDLYWQWVMARFNDELARHYNCKPAIIPEGWKRLNKERALSCLTQPFRQIMH